MKNLLFSLAFMLIGSFAFANTQSFVKQKNLTIENCKDKVTLKYNLGNVTNCSETEIISLIDNLSKELVNIKNVEECTISYEFTFTFMGVSATVSASGTAATCERAGEIARSGIKAEVKAAKTLIKAIGK